MQKERIDIVVPDAVLAETDVMTWFFSCQGLVP